MSVQFAIKFLCSERRMIVSVKERFNHNVDLRGRCGLVCSWDIYVFNGVGIIVYDKQ